MSIAALHTELITARLPRSWGPEAPQNHVVAVTVVADDGATGTGFSWTPTIGATAVKALLDDDLAGFVRGRTENPEALWDDAWKHLHEGGTGLTGVALAGVDLALWDLRARRALDALAEFGPSWLEEPLRADDLEGYRQLRRFSRVPIALGENLHNVYRFRDFIAAGGQTAAGERDFADLLELRGGEGQLG